MAHSSPGLSPEDFETIRDHCDASRIQVQGVEVFDVDHAILQGEIASDASLDWARKLARKLAGQNGVIICASFSSADQASTRYAPTHLLRQALTQLQARRDAQPLGSQGVHLMAGCLGGGLRWQVGHFIQVFANRCFQPHPRSRAVAPDYNDFVADAAVQRVHAPDARLLVLAPLSATIH
jgi:hypothetical protein